MSDTVVVTDTRLDSEKFMLEGIDVSEGPQFTVSEVAKVFFGRSSHWVRWLEGQGGFVLDGEVVGTARTAKGARVYDLSDIEKMTHALAQQGKINGAQAANALLIVQTIARVWQFLP